MADPHDDLHSIAANDAQHDEPVGAAGDETLEEKVDRINKELTKRINDMRTDNDKFQKATSDSVRSLANDVKDSKTAIQNNKDSIEAQNADITAAKKKAETAKTASDAAAAKADEVKKTADANTSKINDTVGKVTALGQQHDKLAREYGGHTHDLTVAFQGTTGRPKAGENE